MPIDLSSFDISLLGWILIAAAAVVLFIAIVRLAGRLLHIVIKGCGVILLVLIVLYVLRLLDVI